MFLDGKIPGLEKGTPYQPSQFVTEKVCAVVLGDGNHCLQPRGRSSTGGGSTSTRAAAAAHIILTYRTTRALLFSPRDASLHFCLLPCAGSQTHQRGAGVGDSARERRKRWAAHCTGTRTAQLLRQSHMIPSFLSSGAGEKSSIELEWKDAVCRSRNRN